VVVVKVVYVWLKEESREDTKDEMMMIKSMMSWVNREGESYHDHIIIRESERSVLRQADSSL
jgi:hypothetical protein